MICYSYFFIISFIRIHTWIGDLPVVVGKAYALYFNLLYVTYDKTNKKIMNISVEGPVPVCSKIFD